MKRSLAVFCLFAFVAATLCAQVAPRRVLTPKDIDAFVANFAALSEELDSFEDQYPNLFDPAVSDDEDVSPSEGLKVMRATEVPAEVDAVFKKHGFGTNGFEKFVVITASVGVAGVLESLSGQRSAYAEYPEMLEYMDQVKSQMEGMKAEIHPDDFALVDSRKAEILPLLDSMEDEEDTDTGDEAGEYGEFDYGDFGE